MRIERIKNTSRNIVFGTVLQIQKVIVPFIMRTLMLYLLGVEYLGLNSLFTSILSVLNLAELGVGAAMVYSMYKPIVDDDSVKICALMNLYKIYYRIIGIVVCILGLSLIPFLPKLIHGNIPADINIYILYLLNLAATVLSYWLFAYKSSILQAYQRNDIISKATLITESIKYSLQFLVLLIFKNYYLYVLAILITQILNNVLTAEFAEKKYPAYFANGNLPKEERKIINHRICDLFTAKVGTVIVYSSDTIVISAFLGLTILAIYQNYYYIFTAVASMINIIFNSVRAGLGNSIIIDTKEKIFKNFKELLLIVIWLSGFCSTCLLCLYQPFMSLWVGEDLLMDFGLVICLSAYFWVYCFNTFLNSYKDASGMWHEDRFRPLVEALTNLTLNIVLVQFIGLYGIILSTVFSMIAVAPWLIHNLFKLIFEKKYLKSFILRIIYYSLVSAIVMAITYYICSYIKMSLIYTIAARLVICFLCSNILMFAFYFKMPEFKQCVSLVKKILNSKRNLCRN